MPTNDEVIRRGGGSSQARSDHSDCPTCNDKQQDDEYPSLQEDIDMEDYYDKKIRKRWNK